MSLTTLGPEANVLIRAAELGLFLPYDVDTKSNVNDPELSTFKKRHYTIRFASVQDIDALMMIEKKCWQDALQSSENHIKQRIVRFPEGNLILQIEDQIAGALYSQRIHDISDITQKNCHNVLSCHVDDGQYIQLLSINVLPEFGYQGLGDQLLSFMLDYAGKISGICGVVAVSLCGAYHKHNTISIQEYVNQRDEDGLLLDPILRFHEYHGGMISGVIKDYRPEDVNNLGYGVLIRYDFQNIHARSTCQATHTKTFRDVPVAKTVKECICKVIPDHFVYTPKQTLKDMGMDSMHLLKMLSLLNKKMGVNLDSTLLFKCSTPEDLIHFLENNQAPDIHATHKNDTLSANTSIESRLQHIETIVQNIDSKVSRVAFTDHKQDTINDRPKEPVAIIGMACRFPHNTHSPEKYWKLLYNGINAVDEVPPSRWALDANDHVNRYGGFIDYHDQFDASFFNISPREANITDPQQRILLEETWKALENAYIDPDRLKKSKTGVFVGVFGHDYERLQTQVSGMYTIDSYFATGTSPSIMSGRLAYFFGFQGPAVTINTACSSSLVAVHLACQSLHNQECTMAIASGINLILAPDMGIVFHKAGMLSNDGKCKTFDQSANGYVRSEGCGVVVLKPLSDAIADKNPILAVIRGSAINQDGTSNGLTAPNANAQEDVIKQALNDAHVHPNNVSYIETHGTGTILGDPVEISAIESVFSKRDPSNPLYLGSVKTNIGHTEGAAGVAGLIKVVLSMQHGHIPKHLHFKQLNPKINLDSISGIIPVKGMQWNNNNQPYIAGVSSFGFSGTNAHMIVESYQDRNIQASVSSNFDHSHNIMVLSAKTKEALKESAKKHDHHLQKMQDVHLSSLCFTANTCRAHFDHRLSIVGQSMSEMQSRLKTFIDDKSDPGLQSGIAKPVKIAFLFTGQGSQYADMGRTLFETQPIFRQALQKCDNILSQYLTHSIIDLIYSKNETKELLHLTAYTQPALFSIEYALAILWRSWGITPDIVLGHSVGEYVAACLAGVFSLEDGLKLISNRAALMQALPTNGEMAAIFADEQTVALAIKPYSENVSIAAYNGPKLIVISGLQQSIVAICQNLEKQGIRATRLNVSHAFHSPLMDPMLTPFKNIANTIDFSSPDIPFITNVHGRLATSEITEPEYWVKHVRQPVQFSKSMNTLFESDYTLFLEIGPHPVLTGMARRIKNQSDYKWLPSLSRGTSDWNQLFKTLGTLYVLGAPVDWRSLYQNDALDYVSLPNYPFQRNTYWFQSNETKTIGPEKKKQTAKELPDWFYKIDWQLKNINFNNGMIRFPEPEMIHKKLIRTLSPNIKTYHDLLNQVESLSIQYICNAFNEMGIPLEPGSMVNKQDYHSTYNLASKQSKMFNHLLNMLEDEQIIERISSGFRLLSHPDCKSPSSISKELSRQYPEAKIMFEILDRCGGALAKVLQNSIDPIQLLFPDADTTSATLLYEDSPAFGPVNLLASQAISTAIAQIASDQELKILEIGAGTGGTTSYILPDLPANQTKYIFSDVSPLFTNKAKERFKSYPFLRFQTLDIEQPPEQQGYRQNSFHIIVAANVLHATKDIHQTIKHVSQLLVPGGILLLVEGSQKRRWVDLIFGMLDGWWLFSDDPVRKSHPLLSVPMWKDVLHENGFQQVTSIQTEKEDHALFPQAVIIAQKQDSLKSDNRPVWCIFADANGVGKEISTCLASNNRKFILINKASAFDIADKNTFHMDPSTPEDYVKLFDSIPSPIAGIIHLWSLDSKAEDITPDMNNHLLSGCGSVLYLVQALSKQDFNIPPKMWLITNACQYVPNEQTSMNVLAAPLWGLGRVIQLEHPELECKLVDIEDMRHKNSARRLFDYLQNPDNEPIVAFRGEKRYVARLSKYPIKQNKPLIQFNSKTSCLITGGLGSIGLMVAQWLADNGAGNIVLLGRNKPNEYAKTLIEKLTKQGVNVAVFNADIGNFKELETVIKTVKQDMPQLKGIIHCAGIFGSGVIASQTWKHFESVFQAKVMGAWYLHYLTRDLELDFFVMFSSIVSMIGASGLSNYTAANAFLDSLAHFRQFNHLPAMSINWGPWTRTGITSVEADKYEHRWQSQGIRTLDPENAIESLAQLLPLSISQVGVLDVDWHTFHRNASLDSENAFFSEFTRTTNESIDSPDLLLNQLSMASSDESHSFMKAHVRSQIAEILGFETPYDLDYHQGFFQMGMDSLTSIELRNRLQSQLNCTLPATITFKYANIHDLANYLVKNHLPEIQPNEIKIETESTQKDSNDDIIAVIGMGCRFPGGADNHELFWELLKNGVNPMSEIPKDRFSMDAFYHDHPATKGKISFKTGAFIEKIDQFDSDFFGISPREAACMDPQQRILLEVTWEALENAACDFQKLKNSNTGVFIGVGQNDYGRLELNVNNPDHISVYSGTGNLASFGPGRISYILGLQGPAMAIDTACSSSLTAIHLACDSLKSKESDMAIAGGVHLIMTPEVSLFLSMSRSVSPDGKCKTFDAAADGFGRGEGCGIIVLKRLSDAIQNKDNIMALIRGSAVNHDGPGSGLTVPSEIAQEKVIQKALSNARVHPEDIFYVEAHGTGTSLGDPIELNALSEALCKDRNAQNPLFVGSAKTNLGHLEAASGVAGIIKTVLSINRGFIPPHLFFNTPNPHVDWQNVKINVSAEGMEWPSDTKRLAGVSSFGMSGINAHIVLESYSHNAHPQSSLTADYIFTLSAKSENALKSLTNRYVEYLSHHRNLSISDICFTVNTGRMHFNYRLAIIVTGVNDLLEKLRAFHPVNQVEDIYYGKISKTDTIAQTKNVISLHETAACYVAGDTINWSDFYTDYTGCRLSLPTYAFEKQRYWTQTDSDKIYETSEQDQPAQQDAPHSFIGKRLSLPFSNEIRFETTINEQNPSYVSDHRVYEIIILPAASHLAMVISAFMEVIDNTACTLNDVFFIKPLLVLEKEERVIQIIFSQTQDRHYAFQLVSCKKEKKEDMSSWITHMNGTINSLDRPQCDNFDDVFNNVENIKQNCKTHLSGDNFYTELNATPYDIIHSFQWAKWFWLGENEAICQMIPPDDSIDTQSYVIHPGLLDSCFQLLNNYWDHSIKDLSLQDYIYVPFSIKELTFYDSPHQNKQLWCHGAIDKNNNTVNQDLYLFSDHGTLYTEVIGFEFRRANQSLIFKDLDKKDLDKKDHEGMYTIEWTPVQMPDTTPSFSTSHWLIFADKNGIGLNAEQILKSQGHQCTVIQEGQGFKRIQSDRFMINPFELNDYTSLFNQLQPADEILHLWSINMPDFQEKNTACIQIIYLIQALVHARWKQSPRLSLITSNVNPVRSSYQSNLSQSTVWGLARVIQIEHPELNCVCVDIDDKGIDYSDDHTMSVISAVQNNRHENQMALYDARLYVPRMIPFQSNEHLDQTKKNSLVVNASYMITGANGALGIQIVKKLISLGCRNIVMISRNGLNASSKQVLESFHTDKRIQWDDIKADVSNYSEIQSIIEDITNHKPPLKGIVHCAGIVEDASILKQDQQLFEKVMAPKINGTWNLHVLTQALKLDFFICFSSISSVIGSWGQSNYAAANAFMDALMHYRHSIGLPGQSMNWGPWANSGMAADVGETRWQNLGLEIIDPEQGLDIFTRQIKINIPQLIVLLTNKQQFPHKYFEQSVPGLISNIFEQKKQDSEKTSHILNELKELPAAMRRTSLLRHIQSKVAEILKKEDSSLIDINEPVFDMGFDSLMTIELRDILQSDLACHLSATLLIDYPSVELLTNYLFENILMLDKKKAEPIVSNDIEESGFDNMDELFENLTDMSDDDILNELVGG